jgi:hypothetical protein
MQGSKGTKIVPLAVSQKCPKHCRAKARLRISSGLVSMEADQQILTSAKSGPVNSQNHLSKTADGVALAPSVDGPIDVLAAHLDQPIRSFAALSSSPNAQNDAAINASCNRAQSSSISLVQSIGRGRGVNRTTANPAS